MNMIWLSSFLLELLILGSPLQGRLRQLLAFMLSVYVTVATVLGLAWFPFGFALAVGIFLPFRLLNIARSIKGRMHPQYLRRVSLRTSLWFMAFHGLAFIAVSSPAYSYWRLLPVIMLVTSALMFGLLIYHVLKTRHIKNTRHFSDKELPTVSVCIPARNETNDLEQCLRLVLANDYPKLEVLVLDDCSQDKTAEVIKSFAHAGVRFVQGDEPEARWLAKNHAYNKLAKEATGELLLFCGVDVRLGPHAIKALVATMLNKKKTMVSVMPLRFYSSLSDAFIQPMRYWWELIPPRKLFRRPAVLSTCWIVDRKMLKKAGGFAAVSHTIIPEGYFARHFIKDDGYSFLRADEELDVRTAKPVGEQWATAIRTNYPQIRRRPEMAFILTAFTFLFLLGPFVLLAYAIIVMDFQLLLLAWVTVSLLIFTHVMILRISDPGNAPIGLIAMPVAAVLEVAIGYISMLRYEFGTIEWKDRNVCIPVMHTIPKKDFLRPLTEGSE